MYGVCHVPVVAVCKQSTTTMQHFQSVFPTKLRVDYEQTKMRKFCRLNDKRTSNFTQIHAELS